MHNERPRDTTSLESLLTRFCNGDKSLTERELERLVTNGNNVGMTPTQLLLATLELDKVRLRWRHIR